MKLLIPEIWVKKKLDLNQVSKVYNLLSQLRISTMFFQLEQCRIDSYKFMFLLQSLTNNQEIKDLHIELESNEIKDLELEQYVKELTLKEEMNCPELQTKTHIRSLNLQLQ